jgi:hypothetical protein
MGLFTGLVLLPLAPVRGVSWISGVLLDAANREMYDPGVIRERLGALGRAYDDGEISQEDFEREEERLLTLLDLLSRARGVHMKEHHFGGGF